MSSELKKSSRIPDFYKKTWQDRLLVIQDFCDLTDEELNFLQNTQLLNVSDACKVIENVVSVMSIPFGIATNFCVNGKDVLIPMVIEEASVVAAASYGAKLARNAGGFTVACDDSIMIGQIQLTSIGDFEAVEQLIMANKEVLLVLANNKDIVLQDLGGGAFDLAIRRLDTLRGVMAVVHLYVDVQDAFGANIVNTMVEEVAEAIEYLTQARSCLKIVTNLTNERMVKARACWDKEILGIETIERILDADAFAHADRFRAVTHNKGIMNGIDAVALATGNDFRAIEAGAHSYAASKGAYKPLTYYKKDTDGNLLGYLEMPLAVGAVGGSTKVHPLSRMAFRILQITSAQELACIMGAVGLAQNFAALRAMVTEGIQKGHMRLHRRKNL